MNLVVIANREIQTGDGVVDVFYTSCDWCRHPFEMSGSKAVALKHEYAEAPITRADAKCTEAVTQTRHCTWNNGNCTGTDTITIEAYGEHDFTGEIAEEQYLVSNATCSSKAVYKKSCSRCNVAGSDTFEHGELARTCGYRNINFRVNK